MSSSIVYCKALRRLEIAEVNHDVGASDITVLLADGKRPVSTEGSGASPGVIGNIIWQRPWDENCHIFRSALNRAEQCGRCVGKPTRPCDISVSNERSQGPQS